MAVGASDVALNIVLSSHDETGPGIATAEGRLAGIRSKVLGLQAAWSIAGTAATTAAGFLSEAANAAADDAASTDRLRKAVENSGASWDATQKSIEDRIAANQDLAFSDDQTRDSLSLLIAETGNVDEAMRRQKLAMDLARGANIDVVTASKLLGKVTDENVNVLKKYGINVDKGASQTELFGLIQQKFGGQAVVYGNSTAGSIAKVKDRIDEWKESIGAALGPAQPFIALLPSMSAGMSMVGLLAGPASAAVTAFGNSAAFTAVKAGVIRAATLAWASVQWLLNVALSANPIGLVVVAIAALVAGVIWAYKNVGWFHDAVDKGFATLKVFAAWLQAVMKPILQWLGDRMKDVGNFFNLLSEGAKKAHDLHIPGFQWGGDVPGPIGAPRLIMAHGGEHVSTVGETSSWMSAVRGLSSPVIENHYHVHMTGIVYGSLHQFTKDIAKEMRLQGAFS